MRPLVLVLDDLHWAEPATLLLLRRLATRPQRSALLLLGTARDTEVRRRAPGDGDDRRDPARPAGRADRPAGLGRGGGRRRRRGADRDAAGRRRRARAARADRQATRSSCGELAQHASDVASVPQSVLEVVAARVARLAERDRAAARARRRRRIGRRRGAAARGLGETEERCLTRSTRHCARATVAELPGSRRLAFVHDLVRDALARRSRPAARLPAPPRRGGARRARRRAPERWLAPLAHHALAGAPSDAGARARATRWRRRGRRSSGWPGRTRSSCSSARRPSRGRRRRRPGGWPRCSSRSATRACARARAIAARVAFEEAAQLARAAPRDDLLARAALGIAGLGVTIVAVDEPLVALLEEALERLETGVGPRCGCDCSRGSRSRSPTRLPRSAGGRSSRRRSRRHAASRDPGALAVALTASHVVHWAPEHLRARLAAADELVALGERAGDLEIELHGRHWRVVDLLERGDVASAADEIGRYERLAAEARLPAFSWYVPAWRAALAGYRGDFPRRDGSPTEAHAQGRRIGDDNAELVLHDANHYTL